MLSYLIHLSFIHKSPHVVSCVKKEWMHVRRNLIKYKGYMLQASKQGYRMKNFGVRAKFRNVVPHEIHFYQ